jgi:hypothetical protein
MGTIGNFRNAILAMCLGWLGFSACLPDPSFPDEPVLSYVGFDPEGESGRRLILHFTDGDGNVGLDQNDTLPPFCTSCEHHQNLKCEYDELRNGEWTHIPLIPEAGQVPFYYRVHRVSPSGTDPSQNGTIEVDMSTWYLPTAHDTLRFRVTLEDRDLNRSNEVITPSFVKP